MIVEISLSDGPTNTCYAPLAVLAAHYQQHHILTPLDQVQMTLKTREFSPPDKLKQVLLSILTGCETLSEVNPRLKAEVNLAAVWGWARFADQSTLSRTLDALTLKQIDSLRQATTAIWQAHSLTRLHDWRGYLWLDFDLSGLPCSARAEESQKGYFSDKKTSPDASWHGSVPSHIEKRSGLTCSPATVIPVNAYSRQWRPPKLL